MKIFILTILVSLTASNIIASELSLEEFLKKVQVQNLNLKLEAAKQRVKNNIKYKKIIKILKAIKKLRLFSRLRV